MKPEGQDPSPSACVDRTWARCFCSPGLSYPIPDNWLCLACFCSEGAFWVCPDFCASSAGCPVSALSQPGTMSQSLVGPNPVPRVSAHYVGPLSAMESKKNFPLTTQ